jgi:hypothetical protein
MVNYDTSRYDPKGTKNLMAIDSADEEIKNLYLEGDPRALRVSMFVWDTSTLSWVRAQQQSMSADLSIIEQATSDIRWKDNRIAYGDDDNVEYVGYHQTMNAAEDDTEWMITHYQYDSKDRVIRVQQTYGAWNTREVIFQ